LLFRVTTSVVAVCGYCQQVVARGGVALEDLGKSNPVLVLPSAFALGSVGRFRGQGFTVVGRAQLRHALGGMWNEWYAALDNGRWVWVAEHQGRVAFLGEVSPTQAPQIRALDAAIPGSRWFSGRGEFVVVERSIATVYAEEGELPWRAAPLERRAAIDLHGHGGVFATLDLGVVGAGEEPKGPTRFFVGEEVDVAALELSQPGGHGASADDALPHVSGSVALACPQCQAPLSLRRPDDSRTVVCAHCGSASSVDEHRHLSLLFSQQLRFSPQIPLGARARLDARLLVNARVQDNLKSLDVEVVAFVVRSVVEDGEVFTFEEYLLATPSRGFFWLVKSDAQWFLYRPLSAADVVESSKGVRFQGANYLLEGRSMPKVEQVMGELYWRVKLGDRSQTADYTRMQYRLTVEKTADEVHWTFGFPLSRSELARVFGVTLASETRGGVAGSPFLSSSDSSFAGETEMGQVLVLGLVCLVVVALVLFDCAGGDIDSDGGSSGGAHRSYSGGSGFSFGK
jgi:hypothetical protein